MAGTVETELKEKRFDENSDCGVFKNIVLWLVRDGRSITTSCDTTSSQSGFSLNVLPGVSMEGNSIPHALMMYDWIPSKFSVGVSQLARTRVTVATF